MNCEDCRALMPDLWTGTLPDADRAPVEMHLASCTACRAEAGQLGAVWQALEQIPIEQPSRSLRTGFYEKLEAWRQGFAEAGALKARPTMFSIWKSWWTANPAFRTGFAVASLALAFAAGFWMNNKREGGQLSQLRTEVVNMRQLVALSLLQQQSASDRLKGVNYAYRAEQPDTEVLAALLYTVNHDQNVNVRLAAVDAIRTYADSPIARKGLTQAIGKQQSPLVQIALIDQIAELRDHAALPALQGLAKDAAADADVRQRAQWAVGKMQ
jgi:hypothetical protein